MARTAAFTNRQNSRLLRIGHCSRLLSGIWGRAYATGLSRSSAATEGARDAPITCPVSEVLWPKAGTGWDHGRSPVVDRVDDLARVDSLEINRRVPEVRMPELPLDDRQRDPFVRHLDGVSVP